MGEPIGKREIFRKYPDVVDVPQLCEMLGGSRPVSKKTAYRMLNAGKIKAFRIGRSYRIPKVNVIRFLQNETPEDCNTVNRRGGAPYAAITRVLCLHHGLFSFQRSTKGFVENVPSPIADFGPLLHPVFSNQGKVFLFSSSPRRCSWKYSDG